MEARLFDACWRYLDMKATGWGNGDLLVKQQRGVVRGMAVLYTEWVRWYQRPGMGNRIASNEKKIKYIKWLEKRWMTRAAAVRKTGLYDTLPESRVASDGITARW